MNQPNKCNVVGMYYHRIYNGGVERVISLMIPLLEKQGIQTVLFTDSPPDELDFSLPESTVRIVVPEEPGEARAKAFKDAIEKHDIYIYIMHGLIIDYRKT